MAARDVRKNINLFLDGKGYAGQVEEFNAPELTQKLEEWRGGGMLGGIELSMGLEVLKASWSLVGYSKDALALFGVSEGAKLPFVAREALESFDGTVTAVAHTMRGKVTSLKPGTSKPGELAPLQMEASLVYYKLTHGGSVVHEIDVENSVYILNGVDQLAAQRQALGI